MNDDIKKTEISELGEFGLIERLTKDIQIKNESTSNSIFLSAESLSTSDNNSLLALGLANGLVILFDFETGEEISTWYAHTDRVINLDFSQDGSMLATSGADGFIKLWGVWP